MQDRPDDIVKFRDTKLFTYKFEKQLFFSRQSNNKFQDTVKRGSVQIDTQYEPTYNTLILHNISELPVQIELILSGVNDNS